ncbi:MAG: NUDIX hydrolase [Proteobacteria bacterium]|nr:NUDIX hydrolase [Pseudomonadota bacterium]
MKNMLGGESTGAIPSPVDAATVVLVRDVESGPFEVFLMRRSRNQSFMGSAFVYPGGKLDPEDVAPDLAAWGRGVTIDEARRALNENGLPNETVLGLYFAALRETFEESGVLLASRADGERIDFSDPAVQKRFGEHRRAVLAGKMDLKSLAEQEGLRYSLDRLTPYAHWITPEIESRRFDTRFFLARIPRDQVPVHDSIEMTESLWITPTRALEDARAGRLMLMPPTYKTMEELSAFSTLDALLASAVRRPPKTIQPQPFKEGDLFGLKLPHDPEYGIEAYRQPHRPDEPCRIVMTETGWRAYCYQDFQAMREGKKG